jgi:type IV secretory pathway TraG/TraD family ATPase VirD4
MLGQLRRKEFRCTQQDWITAKKLVYVNLNTLGFEETSRRFGRLLLQDIKTAVQRIQNLEEGARPKTSVILDEFASIASSGFIELLNKARSANVSLTLAHQSLGDLVNISESFRDQVLDNTNCKVLFRVDSPDTADYLARLIGTRTSQKKTNQTQGSSILGDSNTGKGTVRDTEEFIVSPNDIKRLERGQAIVITKMPYKFSRVRFKPTKQRINEHLNLNKGRTPWYKNFRWS